MSAHSPFGTVCISIRPGHCMLADRGSAGVPKSRSHRVITARRPADLFGGGCHRKKAGPQLVQIWTIGAQAATTRQPAAQAQSRQVAQAPLLLVSAGGLRAGAAAGATGAGDPVS